MTVFTIYLLLFSFLIYKTGFFGLLKDDVLNSRFYLLAFIIKCIGIAIVGIIYKNLYGTPNYLDAGNFFNDAKVIHDIAGSDFFQFIKVMFGLHDESTTSDLFINHIGKTVVWDKNPDEFFYNDNRIIIRLHALIYFISFNNYFVHALFNSVIALIGINWIYKTFKFLFTGKEVSLFMCWLIFPGLLFWTSGLFKEAPTLFVMGLLLISLKRIIIDKDYRVKNFISLSVCIIISFLLKPFILIPVLFLSALFFFVHTIKFLAKKSFAFISIVLASLVCSNFILQAITSQNILSLLSQRQATFVDISHGGLFLLNTEKYIRLPYDYSKIDTVQGKTKVKIKKGASFIYWEHTHQQDTLQETNNNDTISQFKLYNNFPAAKSTIDIPLLNNSYISLLKNLPLALYITLFKPFFFDARNGMDTMASFENILIVIALILLLIDGIKNRLQNPWPIYFLSVAVSVLLIIGITSPNIGAIERYRALVIPFVLIGAILTINTQRFEQSRVFIFFKRPSQNSN